MATGDASETLIDIDSTSEDEEPMAEHDTEDLAAGMVEELAKTLRLLVSMGLTNQFRILSLKASFEATETRPEAISESGPASATFMECLDQYNRLKGNVEIVMKRSRESLEFERRFHIEVNEIT